MICFIFQFTIHRTVETEEFHIRISFIIQVLKQGWFYPENPLKVPTAPYTHTCVQIDIHIMQTENSG